MSDGQNMPIIVCETVVLVALNEPHGYNKYRVSGTIDGARGDCFLIVSNRGSQPVPKDILLRFGAEALREQLPRSGTAALRAQSTAERM